MIEKAGEFLGGGNPPRSESNRSCDRTFSESRPYCMQGRVAVRLDHSTITAVLRGVDDLP